MNMPRPSMLWIYGLIGAFIIGWYVFGDVNDTPLPSDWTTVREMVEKGDVEKIQVVNRDQAQVFLKKEAAEQYRRDTVDKRFKRLPETGVQLTFTIGSVDSFREDLKNAEQQSGQTVPVVYENKANDWTNVLNLLPWVLIIGVWIFVMRSMSRGAGGGAGGGIMISNTSDAMRDIVRRLGVRSTATLLGLGAIPADEKGYLSFAGMHGSYGANMAIQECDLLLCIGMRFSDRVTGKVSEFAPHAKIVHFEIDRAELNKNVKADYSVLGDLSWSLPLLRDKLNACEDDFASKFAPWLEHALELEAKHPFGYREEGEAIKPGALISKVSSLMGRDAIGVTDVGQHQMWAAQFFKVYKPRHFLTSGGQGTMGYGLPAAMGAKVGCPDTPVVLFTGDGSIMMNCQEFATIADNDIDVKVVVIRNEILGMVGQWQRLFYNHHYSQSELKGKTDLVKLAEAMGVKGYRLTKKEELETRLPEILAEKGAVLIDVVIPEEEDVLPMVPGGKRLDQMVLGYL